MKIVCLDFCLRSWLKVCLVATALLIFTAGSLAEGKEAQSVNAGKVAKGPLPEFTLKGVVLHPDHLKYSPRNDLIHPTIIKTEGRIKNPLGKYYLYHAPHKHIAISMAYSDSMEGPWIAYEANPVIEGPSAPDIRWMEEHGKFFMWGHTINSQTELWTSEDGIHFKHHSVSVKAERIGTRNATYSRVYTYPLKQYGSRYVMVYSGFDEKREIRCVWLAHSKDGMTWTQLKTPLLEPIKGEHNDCYGPAILCWQGKNYLTYQDHTSWRGGNMKYVVLDEALNPVGQDAPRYVLMDPPDNDIWRDRYRGGEFYYEGDKLYLYTSGARNPRVIGYAVADVPVAKVAPQAATSSEAKNRSSALSMPVKKQAQQPVINSKTKKEIAPNALDGILKDYTLKTIYETAFDKPLRMMRESELVEAGGYVRQPPQAIDWVLEGPARIEVKNGRMHVFNLQDSNCVLWHTRQFPESFVATWDFQHHHPQGLAILFFAAHKGGSALEPKSIYTAGLTPRTGNFGNYTRGMINSYHTSYTAIDEKGQPRGATHLKKNAGAKVKGGKLAKGLTTIDGKSGRPHLFRLAKLNNRIILEIDGQISFDFTDKGEKGGGPYGAGQIGFRQMRHAIEGSYGGLKIQSVEAR